jgi:hypothetical protein
VGKRPVESAGDAPYVLVNLSPVLGPELEQAVGDRGALLLSEAEAFRMGCRPGPEPQASTDPPRRDIVIVSPTHPEGLSRLLTQEVNKQLLIYARSETPNADSFIQQILSVLR